MNLASKKRIAADLIGISKDRVWLDDEYAEDIKSALTRQDIKRLIVKGIIRAKQKRCSSRVRARKILVQKRKGKKKGEGKRKGKSTARLSRKESWMEKIRSQRTFINELKAKERITRKTYTSLRGKAKSGIFRNKRHIKLYLEDNKLFVEKKKKDGK